MEYFLIHGEPVAQGRPRFSTRGNLVRTYDPKKSRDWKDYAKYILKYSMQRRKYTLIEEACRLSIKVYKSIPKSYSKKKTQMCMNGTIRPSVKPDLDNYIKAVKDAMGGDKDNKIVWYDDSLVVEYFDCGKYYAGKGELPRVEIMVETIREYKERIKDES